MQKVQRLPLVYLLLAPVMTEGPFVLYPEGVVRLPVVGVVSVYSYRMMSDDEREDE